MKHFIHFTSKSCKKKIEVKVCVSSLGAHGHPISVDWPTKCLLFFWNISHAAYQSRFGLFRI